MKVCPNCLAEYEDHLNFCRRDGTVLKPKVAEVAKDQPSADRALLIEKAENYLREGNYQKAITTLDILKANPDDQEVRLLHLYASIKLYNIYGYERQIESLRHLSGLTEKEREIAREIFLIRSEEAQKRGRQDEAHEYQRLATRVMLGQPLTEQTPETKKLEASSPREPIKPSPQKAEQMIPLTPKPTPAMENPTSTPGRREARASKKVSRLFVSFLLVFGLVAVLVAGMLGYYARQRGIGVWDLFKTKSQNTSLPEERQRVPGPAPVAQVIGVRELGFRVWGDGAVDVNRQGSLISEGIESQLGSLRLLYQQEVQQKPDLMGSLTLQLTISPAGSVTKVEEFGSRIKDNEFKKSVIQEAYKWRFPEASSGLVKVNYPLLFVPAGMDVATLVKWEQLAEPKGLEAGVSKEMGPTAEKRWRPEPEVKVTEKVIEKERRIVLGTYELLYPTSVYSEPREDSQRVARIEAGTRVNVVDIRGDWLEIRSKHGRPPGFIKKESAAPTGSR